MSWTIFYKKKLSQKVKGHFLSKFPKKGLFKFSISLMSFIMFYCTLVTILQLQQKMINSFLTLGLFFVLSSFKRKVVGGCQVNGDLVKLFKRGTCWKGDLWKGDWDPLATFHNLSKHLRSVLWNASLLSRISSPISRKDVICGPNWLKYTVKTIST